MKDQKLTGYPSVDKPWLKYYSKEAISTPLPECTIYEYLWERNKDYLSATALRYFGRRFSFRELFENIDRTANAFASLGLKKGDIIIMATATIPETVYALYGLNKIGVIPNMVDPRTSAEGIRDYILEVDAKVVMTLDIAYDRIADAVRGTNVDTIIVASPGDSLPPVKRAMYKALNRLKGIVPKLDKRSYLWTQFIADGQQDIVRSVPYEKDTCCVIVHTGGTTGFPKGVMLSNDNVNALAVQSILTGIDMTRELPYGEMGEICISGPNVMLGYYNNPDETANILRTHTDGRVWVHSGDLGYMNKKGSLFIVDRMKKVIIKHDGFKVFPSAIEKVIISHPGIEKCCVVGAPDRNHAYGKEPVAFLVICPGYADDTQALKQELILLCRKELPEYVQPEEYRFVDAFPMTAIGKVDFRALEKEAQHL